MIAPPDRRPVTALARLALAAVTIVACSAACSIDADYTDTAFSCVESGECPPGFSCSAGVCRSGDAPDAAAGCSAGGAVGALTGGFSDSDSLWQIDSDGANVVVDSGEASITLPAQGTSSGSLTSRCGYDLAGARVAVELLSVPDGARALFEARPRGDDARFAFEIDGGELVMVFEQGGDATRASIEFREANHRFLAISGQDGYFVFETSTNGRSWIPQRSHEQPDRLGDLALRFAAEAEAPDTGHVVRFGNLQGTQL